MSLYLDPHQSIERRIEDLLPRMTVAEKAGLMFHPSTEPPGEQVSAKEANDAAVRDVVGRGISHFNVFGGDDSATVAAWHNTLQNLAASTRLGIPVTLSSDPRHGFRSNPFTGQSLTSLSRWPETTGIAAIAGTDAVRQYGETIRAEFLAMGIRVYLGPMADIFSEPRWSRGAGTFGEDPERVSELTVAFIEALRGGPELSERSVAAVVKHFPGGGPQLRGDDAHDKRYPEQIYPGGQQELHIRPFERAFSAGATQVMTYYGKPVSSDWDEVGFAFNAPVVRDILRGRLRFDGIVVTDWNLLESEMVGDYLFGPNGWGLEDRTPAERAQIAIEVGVDQFGGDRNTAIIEELVDAGVVTQARIDESVRRILREKFRLGIFEQRAVDVEQARQTCGASVFFDRGVAAQRGSLVLLSERAGLLPEHATLFLDGIDDPCGRPTTTDMIAADAIVVRLDAPFEPGRGSLVAEYFHGGTLEFPAATLKRLQEYAELAPLFVAVFLERPAILGPIIDLGATVVGEFGASDAVVLDAFCARAPLSGRLPFDIPSSMAAVEASREDVPFDTESPRFRAGDGIEKPARAIPER
ncbi:glycoside hydrolase family 3 N-terminal domain-containing protein [Rathayibacter sp. VKM Ac-2760]|uniref:glycoside hydrolase family 3 protein n=1 Tax=Rathayibacter sp. VKM Ac-2760 TaxID=2609253 RepID=UPI001318AB17|nr:glycoside hydrolase family 3 N-terminal domain-containing protein [Rathayibacter sp. VKM Ac-2760]QHC58752.1 glycoside hydrolase family 3 protein [Rathayibacter sp. VKM Ac-2760]